MRSGLSSLWKVILNRSQRSGRTRVRPQCQTGSFYIEPLEERRLLSSSASLTDLNVDVYQETSASPVLASSVRSDVSLQLHASAPSTQYGQAITLTAIVITSSGTPTGSCTFMDGDTAIGVVDPDNDGRAVLTTGLAVSTHEITAVYSGDNNFSGATSSPLVLAVDPIPTTASIEASPAAPVYGQSISIHVAIQSAANNLVVSGGSVAIKDGSKVLGNASLSDGQATFTLNGLSVGHHEITAHYPGDGNHFASTSPALALDVALAPSKVTVTTPGSTPLGQPVTLAARVAGLRFGTGQATGWVTFKDGDKTLGISAIRDGVARFTTSSLARGKHSITAIYQGDRSFDGSRSSPVRQAITPATVVDFMTVYTPQARRAAGGDEPMYHLITEAVRDTNEAFRNSRIPVTIRLVGLSEVAYSESGDMSSDLDYLMMKSDGYMDNVHALRNRYGADLVALFEGDGDLGGIAYQLQNTHDQRNPRLAFSVVYVHQAGEPYYTLAHELGHNFGAMHDEDNATGSGGFPYSHGYRFWVNGTEYHDIMSYDPGITIPYFSNPSVLYRGTPIGLPGIADSARVIRQTAPVVAAYRHTTIKGVTPTVAQLKSAQNAVPRGQLITLTARIAGREADAGTPSGKVVFRDGGTILGTAKLKYGKAIWTGKLLSSGKHPITATFLGNAHFAPSVSATLKQNVYVRRP